MSTDDPAHSDAFSLPFQAHFRRFLAAFPDQSSIDALPTHEKLVRLSILLKNPLYTAQIARLFSPLLVDLCARWLDDEEQDEAKFAVFGLLVPAHEELYPYAPSFLFTSLSFISLTLISESSPSFCAGPLWSMGHSDS